MMPTDHARQSALAAVYARHASRSKAKSRSLRVCHVMSADLWAGAEVQVATTAACLVRQPEIALNAVLFNDGPLADQLRRLGVPTTIIDERRVSRLAVVRRLTRHLRDRRIDLVHTHRHSDTVIGTMAAALAGVPRVVRTVHGLREPLKGWPRLRYRAYEALERGAARIGIDAVVAVSRFVASDLEAQGYDTGRITPIHNGIDLEQVKATRSREEVRRALGLGAGDIVIGTAGRLTAVKAQERLLRAAQIIRSREPRASFLIVGDGPRRQALSDFAARLGIADACVFTGSRQDAYDLVAAMDIFALTSISEGTPMALLEAMALGVPVVATAVGGVPEIVEDGVNGLLVTSGDDDALARACLELASNEILAHRLAARGRQRVNDFSSRDSGAALVRLYSEVVTAPRKSGVVLRTAPWLGVAVTTSDRIADRIRFGRERRRQQRLRVRNGLRLAAALRKATRLLVVCHGNIIRSAYAAQLLKCSVPASFCPDIFSAGVQTVTGRPADPRAAAEASARGIDLSRHVSSALDRHAIQNADVVLVMDVPQLLSVRERFPAARTKTFLLATLADNAPLEIADPVLGDRAVFERCFDQVERAVAPVARVLSMRSVAGC